MPSANTKPVAARIPKDHYYLLLREAADRQMTISKFLEDVVIRSFLRPKEVVQTAEKGAKLQVVQTAEKGAKLQEIKKTKCVVFDDFPDLIVREVVGGYSMHTIGKDNKVSRGVIGKQLANGSIVFEGYEVFFGNNGKWNSRTAFGLRTRVTELEINWY
jgi:hypothetical protein